MMREYGLFCYCQQKESVMQQSMQKIFSDCHHYILTLKGPRSSMYTQSSKLYLYGCELFSTLSYVKNICDIDDQNSKHMFASKGTHAVYLNPNLQWH
jgi:hypothetical protein